MLWIVEPPTLTQIYRRPDRQCTKELGWRGLASAGTSHSLVTTVQYQVIFDHRLRDVWTIVQEMRASQESGFLWLLRA